VVALAVTALVTLAPLASEAEAAEGDDGSDDKAWIAEELLRELRALREQNTAIKKELSALREKVEALEKQQAALQGAGDERASGEPKSVRFDPARLRGSASADVAIIEFTDYQCPYCGRHHKKVYPKIERELIETGKARYAVMDFPLPMHDKAVGASMAARCAKEQEAFWRMHHALFSNQQELGQELYMEQAKRLGLDGDDLRACLDDEAKRRAVNDSVVYGQKVGVKGTPHFVIGRIKGDRVVDVTSVSGVQPYGVFESRVKRLQESATD
jgi:protein-disulfide isomerase